MGGEERLDKSDYAMLQVLADAHLSKLVGDNHGLTSGIRVLTHCWLSRYSCRADGHHYPLSRWGPDRDALQRDWQLTSIEAVHVCSHLSLSLIFAHRFGANAA